MQKSLNEARATYLRDTDIVSRYRLTADVLMSLRRGLPTIKSAPDRLRALDLSIAVEEENLRLGNTIRAAIDKAPRGGNLILMRAAADAAYGTGLLNERERSCAAEVVRDARARPRCSCAPTWRELRYLGLVPGWGTQQLRFHFGEAMDKLAEIEPKAELFVQDQLRGSPLLFYSQVLDALNARRQPAGRRAAHSCFGKEIGAGFNALNPGLARGVLHTSPDMQRAEPVPRGRHLRAAGDGGRPAADRRHPHRRRGQPAVARAAARAQPRHPERRGRPVACCPTLQQADGRRVVLAVSSGGLVEIADDGPQWDAVFGTGEAAGRERRCSSPT